MKANITAHYIDTNRDTGLDLPICPSRADPFRKAHSFLLPDFGYHKATVILQLKMLPLCFSIFSYIHGGFLLDKPLLDKDFLLQIVVWLFLFLLVYLFSLMLPRVTVCSLGNSELLPSFSKASLPCPVSAMWWPPCCVHSVSDLHVISLPCGDLHADICSLPALPFFFSTL